MDPEDYPSYERTPGFPPAAPCRQEKYTQTYLAPSDEHHSRRAKFPPSRVRDTCKTRFFHLFFFLPWKARATSTEFCGDRKKNRRARSGGMRARRKNSREIRETRNTKEARRCNLSSCGISRFSITMRNESVNSVTRVRTTHARSEFRIINGTAFPD